MSAFVTRAGTGAAAQRVLDPAEITLPPPTREAKRMSRLMAGIRHFGARLNARARWMKEFLHSGQ